MQETQETRVRSLGQEDPLEEEMATHSSVLENPMDRGAWRAAVHGVIKSRTQLNTHTHRHTHLGFRAHPESELMCLISLVAWSDPRTPFPLGG